MGNKTRGIFLGAWALGVAYPLGPLAVSCKAAEQGDGQEGKPRHPQRHTLKPEKMPHASKDLLSQTQGGY